MIGKLFKRELKPKFTTEIVNRGGKSCRVNIKKDGIRYGYAELYLWDEEVDVVKFENVIKLAIK
jgi:hypothetical protein